MYDERVKENMTKEEVKKETQEIREQMLEELNQTVIYKNGEIFLEYSAFYSGDLDSLVPMDKNMFKWHFDEKASEFSDNPVFSITLGEIAEQLAKIEYAGIVTLFVNRPTSGEVYQLGNYGTYQWFELGTLRGFA